MFRPKSKSCRSEPEISESAAPACFPRAHSLKQQERSPESFLLIYAPTSAASQLHQRTLSLRTSSQGQPSLLRPRRQQIEGHAENNVDGNDQDSEEPGRAAAVGDKG